jgi:hypothetical protein
MVGQPARSRDPAVPDLAMESHCRLESRRHGWLPLLVIFDDHHLWHVDAVRGPSTPLVGGLVIQVIHGTDHLGKFKRSPGAQAKAASSREERITTRRTANRVR